MKFYIKQKVFSFRDKFRVMDESQNEVYQVAGKLMSISNKLELQNDAGDVVLKSKKKVISFLPKYFIYSPYDEEVAVIKKHLALKPKFTIYLGEEELTVSGSFFAHSFGIIKDGKEVASIEKKVFSFGDSYEIEILEEDKAELFLFIVIIIDQVIHENKNNR